ncbi:amidohydrolase family protein [Embleya sp. NPDC020630]|uniref:amidohydrolase family protein n=1 Tax=Embleya sp. NPDC020630 TaxID=3363979 RepID=UPI003790F100
MTAPMWLTNCHVVDVVTGEVLRDRSVHIDNGVIVEVAADAPADADVHDLGGRHLLPGLITCHSHMSIVFPFSETREDEPAELTAFRAAQRAADALHAGVTTMRCVHEQNRIDFVLREARARGFIRAPRVFGAGRALSTPGGHGEGSDCVYVKGADAFYHAAIGELEAGADHIKIFINSGLAREGEDFEHAEMTDAEIAATVKAADEHGAYVVAHAGESAAIRQAVELGVRSFEHIYALDAETARLLAEREAFVTPTLCVTNSLGWMRDNHFDEGSVVNAKNAIAPHQESFRRAVEAGVQLVNGTDVPPGDRVDGVSAVVHEMYLMAKGGLDNLRVLQAATVTAARLIRAEDRLGRIAPGYAADLIAVDGDPLSDLGAMGRMSFVMLEGEVVREDVPV